MTPEMMLQLVMEGEFDPEEVEQIAGSGIGYIDPITTQADDGTRLILEPQGKFSPSSDQHWTVYFVRDKGAIQGAMNIAGELWRYKSWGIGSWSAHPNPTFYFGRSWGGFQMKAPSVTVAAQRLYNIIKSSPRNAFTRAHA